MIAKKPESDELSLQSGFTWRTILAIVYAAIVLLPAHLWLQLSSGIMLDLGLRYATLLLFVEVSRMWGKKLTKQEVFIIWAMTSQIAWEVGLGFPIGMIYRAWYATSPIARAFQLADYIPFWWAPPNANELLNIRTFFNYEWVMPFALTLIAGLLWRLTDLTMGYICRHIYVVTENLPFPMARVGADTSLALSERPSDMMQTLILSAAIGQLYSILVFVPMIIYGSSLVPYPWIDLTRFIEKLTPGASLAIATDLITLSSGLVMPFTAVVSIFIGSFLLYFLGNWLTSPESPLSITRGLFRDWVFGMKVEEAYVRSNLYVWASVLIGLALAGGLIPVLRRPKTLIRSLSALRSIKRSETGMSFYTLITIYILATAGSAILVHMLVPSFPLAVLLFISVVWVFIINLIGARSLGEIGVSLDMNSLYVTQGLFTVFSTNPQIWFASSYLVTTNYGAGWCQNFKICELTGTSISSYVKAYFFTFPLATILGILFTQALWTIAPIPSSTYPYTNVQFPVNAQWFSLWASKSLTLFNPLVILQSFSLASVAYFVFEFLHLPFSIMAFTVGAMSPIWSSATILIGGIIGLVLKRVGGKDWWERNKAVAAAGLTLGEGIVVAVATAVAVIQKSMWVLPF